MFRIAFILFLACMEFAICCDIASQSYGKENLREDISAIYKQCKAKNYNACYILGLDYYYGHISVPDKDKSQYFLSLACNKDIDKACIALVEFGLSNSFNNIEKACNVGNLDACIKLKDIMLASYSKDAIQAELDSIQAKMCTMDYTYCYSNIDNVSKDIIQLYSKVCDTNTKNNKDNLICGVLGDIYSQGRVVPKNSVIAKSYYDMACYDNNEFCKRAMLETILNQ